MFLKFLNTFKRNTHYTLLTNFYLGLARGPIDHNASSVINVIANGSIEMGSVVTLDTTVESAELLPRVDQAAASQGIASYGIAVGGDTDGIFSTTGVLSGTDATLATASAGQGVVIVTQGRCLARVDGTGGGAVSVGSQLTVSDTRTGTLELAITGDFVIAIALQDPTGDEDIIAVDVQREGTVA